MRLEDIEAFVLAVQEGSVTAAARRLFRTQPAVTARLQRLEELFREPLLRRHGRGVRPTSSGALLYARALPLLEELRRLEDDLADAGTIRGRLSIGATDLVAVYHLPQVLRRLRAEHPDLEVTVQVEGTVPLLRALEEGRIELALATLPVPEVRLEAVPLFDDEVRIVAPAGHPSLRARGVEPAAIASYPWIAHKRDSLTRQMLESFFSSHGATLRTEMEISNPEAIKALVEAGLGLAALPAKAVEREVQEGRLAVVRVKGFELRRLSGLVSRRTSPPTRAAQALVDTLRIEASARRRRPRRPAPGPDRRPGPRRGS